MPIETVFLDAGGVLVFPNWVRISEALRRHGVSADPVALAAAEPFVKREIDEAHVVASSNDGKLGWLYFDRLFQRAGISSGAPTSAAVRELYEYHQESNLWEYVPPLVEPSLQALRDLGLRLVVVSNANGRLAVLFARIGLAKYFDYMLDSFVEGVEKPDPKLFEIALERSGSRAESTVHVGDLYHVDVAGARAAGLQAVLMDPADLYQDADCPRVQSMAQLAAMLKASSVRGRSA